MLALLDEQRQVRRLARVEGAAHRRDDLVARGDRRRRERARELGGALRVEELLREHGLELFVHRDVEEAALRADARHEQQQFEAHLVAAVRGSAALPERCVASAERVVRRAGEERVERRRFLHARARFHFRVERVSAREDLAVVAPDLLGGRLVGAGLEIEEVVELAEEAHWVREETRGAVFDSPEVAVEAAEEAAEHVSVREEPPERALQQRLLRLEHAARFLIRRGLEQRVEREVEIEVVDALAQRADGAEVRAHEARVRLGHDTVAEEPLNQAVMNFEVGLEIVAAQLRAAQDLGHPLVVLTARGARAQQQRDVRIVGARDVVIDERVRIGVAQANALIEAKLAFAGRRPGLNQPARVRLQRRIRGVDAHLET